MERILDCAENPLHRIATTAKVNQALISYYFGSKEKLYLAVFFRRGLELTQQRLKLLDELENRRSGPPTVEELIKSFLAPAIKLMHEDGRGRDFLRLQARLQSEPKEIAAKLRAAVYDRATRRYIESFKAALPHVDPDAIVWRTVMMIGAYLYIMSDPNRLRQLSDGACDIDDQAEVIGQLSSFLAGGFKSSTSNTETRRSVPATQREPIQGLGS
jgi:AcrR family transcriptional regulator